MVQFNFNLSYIVHKKINCNNSVLKELRKLMDRPRATNENVYVINILQNSTRVLRSSHEKAGKFFQGKADSKATKHFVSYH